LSVFRSIRSKATLSAGAFPISLRFGFSNCTDGPIVLRLLAIESGSGSTWTNFHIPTQPLELQFAEETHKSADVLAPHASEEAHLRGFRIRLPTSGAWRIRARVFRKQNPLEERTSAALAGLRRWGLVRGRVNQKAISVADRLVSGRLLVLYKPVCDVASDSTFSRVMIRTERTQAGLGTPTSRAQPDAIMRAREALRQRLYELDTQSPHRPIPSKGE